MSNKNNSKKPKRGVKTSYGNYNNLQNPFVNNKFKLHKARKSLITNGSKKSIQNYSYAFENPT